MMRINLWNGGNYFLIIFQERRKETVKAINIPDIEKRKKRRISRSFMMEYLFSNIPT
jgi:predicted peptidase